MTRPYRRDKDVRSASIIAGLRLEPDLARDLVAFARHQAAERGEKIANVASAARELLRLGLGRTRAEACTHEGYFRGLAEARKQMAGSLNGLAGAAR